MAYTAIRRQINESRYEGEPVLKVRVLKQVALSRYRFSVTTLRTIWLCETPQDVSWVTERLIKEKLQVKNDTQST